MQQLEHWPLDRLVEYIRNPRRNDHAVDRVAAAIREFGFKVPIVARSDGTVVDGHLRLKAAKKLGLAEVPVLLADDLTPAQVQAFRLSVNKMAELADWDTELLALEFVDLKDIGFDLELTGFDLDEIAALLAPKPGEGLTDPDETPEAPSTPVSDLGDVWTLGRHRILCGNSTKQDDVQRVMAGKRADVVFTDPPYGVAYHGSSGSGSIAGDITQTAIPIAFKQAIDHATTDDARLYFCGGSSNVQMYYSLFDAYLRKMPAIIIWDKGSIVLRRNNYHSQFEVIFYGWKGSGGANKYWYGPRTADCASDIWKVKRDNGADYVHPTQKPTELAERAIGNSCPPAGLVYEPFSGSGSTMIAAEMTGRCCNAIELSPAYVDVAVTRWQQFTGGTARLEETGETFVEVMARRRPEQQVKATAVA